MLIKSLGADYWLDYKRSSPLCLHFDCVSVLDKYDMPDRLNPGGHFVSVGGMKVAKETREILEQLMAWAADGRYQAVINRVYPLEDMVVSHEYLYSKQKQGNIVIEVSE